MVVMTNVYLVLYLIQFHPGLRCSLEHLRVHSLELRLFLIDCATRSCRYREGEGGGSCSAGGVGGALASPFGDGEDDGMVVQEEKTTCNNNNKPNKTQHGMITRTWTMFSRFCV